MSSTSQFANYNVSLNEFYEVIDIAIKFMKIFPDSTLNTVTYVLPENGMNDGMKHFIISKSQDVSV